MLRPTDDIAPDGIRILLIMKDHSPKELIADEKVMLNVWLEQ